MRLDIQPLSAKSEALLPLMLYHNRYRSGPEGAGVFLLYSDHGSDVLHVEPRNYVQSPRVLRERLLSEGRLTSAPHGGGTFSTEVFDFTMLLSIAPAEIPQIFVRLVATLAAEGSTKFDLYLDAAILVRSAPSGFGTIRDVVGIPKPNLH